MKKMIIALFAVTLLVPSLALGWGENNIGMYTTETPAPGGEDAEAQLIAPTFGQYSIYVVLTRPWNFNTGGPIANVGGYEFEMSDLPPGWSFAGFVFPPNTTDFNGNDQQFFVSGQIPVTGESALLVEIQIGTFDATPEAGHIWIAPYFAPSIPGAMAVTDFDDGFSISEAFPSSGDYGLPVFGINAAVVPSEDASWGGVKSMFK